MSNSKLDDPRDASLEVAFSLPPTWYQKALVYGLNTSGMFLSGLIMVTRNRHLTCIPRLLAWPAVLFSLNQLINQHPLRSKDGAGGWSNMMLCISALVASYLPVFVITNPTTPSA
ncbi:hypothetical protein BDQ17DRAFT_1233374 [Cyathus striatus]|nr:hypothetical protein BDQ17DRAFT_1233374 [Cyathus striatus]